MALTALAEEVAWASLTLTAETQNQSQATTNATQPWSDSNGLTEPATTTLGPSGGGGAILTLDQRRRAENILVIVRYVAMALAVPLTLCNLLVFLQKRMRSAAAVYVNGISAAQLVYILTNAVGILFMELVPFPQRYLANYVLVHYGMVVLGTVARRSSYLIMTIVSAERFYAVLRPLHVKSFFLSRRPLPVLTSAYVLTFLLHIYLVAKYEVITLTDPATGRFLRYSLVRTSLYGRTQDVSDFFNVASKFVLIVVALGAQIGLNVLTIVFLRRHNTQSKMMTTTAATSKEDAKQRQERVLTVTILSASIGYVVLSLPGAVHVTVNVLVPEYYGSRPESQYRNFYSVCSYFVTDLGVICCAIDFVCFALLSSRYRRELARIFGRCGKGKTSSSLAATQSQTITETVVS